MKVLVIEDDLAIGKMIERGLQTAGYEITRAVDGAEGLAFALSQSYSLIILDLMLPGGDGWKVCAELRAADCDVPVLMLTARDSVEDLVRGLDTGADDYLAKPFDFQELLARVRALLRRDKKHRVRVIRLGDLEIDTAARRVTWQGRDVALTHREYALLEALAASEGRVLTRADIQERVWMNEQSTSNTVDVYIGMLRRKLEAVVPVKLIHTVHGAGYTLRRPEREDLA